MIVPVGLPKCQPHLLAVHPADGPTRLWRPMNGGITVPNRLDYKMRPVSGSSDTGSNSPALR